MFVRLLVSPVLVHKNAKSKNKAKYRAVHKLAQQKYTT